VYCMGRKALCWRLGVSCYRPLKAFRSSNGEVRLGEAPGDGYPLELPCSRCIGCKLDRARAWSIRITHEASLYDSNLFVTFTYDDAKLPKGSWSLFSLEYGDFHRFMKQLRRKYRGVSKSVDGRTPIRFFVSGEYGGRTKRPHWHAILFNMRFPDQQRLMNGTYRSTICDELWKYGNTVIGDVTPQSASYVAGYTLKKVHGARAPEHYEDVVDTSTGELLARRPEFVVMSRRPGIGSWWYDRYGRDCFPNDFAVQEGKKYKVPRYYWKRFEVEADAGIVEDVAFARELRARARVSDSTPERRLVREVVAERRAALFGEREL